MRACALFVLLGAVAVAEDEKLVAPLAPDPARDARVEALIDKLERVDAPWYGITDASGGGVAFDAVEQRGIVPTALRDLPRAGPPPAFRELVRLGPAAIPALLEHLDDRRETRLSFHREAEGMGGMFARPELFAGCADERSLIVSVLGARALKNATEDATDDDLGEVIRDHTVTVGDCCFALLGQIVNRPYEAVRYQPTLCTVVSSPTREPRLAEALRAWWRRGDPRQVLAQSLHGDLVNADGLETGAVLRLSVYFPDEADALIAKGIAAYPWDRRSRESGAEFLRAALATGHLLARAEWVKLLDRDRPERAQLAALAAVPEDPGDEARERIRAIRDGSEDLDLVVASVAALPGERSPKAFAWLRERFGAVEKRDPRQAQRILEALAALDEERSLPIFVAHTEKLGRFGRANVLAALGGTPRPRLAEALLPAVLATTDPVGPMEGMPVPVRADTRWCDWAAAIIARAWPSLPFDPEADVAERDRRIAAMRAALAK